MHTLVITWGSYADLFVLFVGGDFVKCMLEMEEMGRFEMGLMQD